MIIGEDKSIRKTIMKYGRDILTSDSFYSLTQFIQHGTITVYEHVLAVTYMSVYLARKKRRRVNMKSIVRGALLHDYFLYDWHDNALWHSLHGYHHAKRAMENARRDFPLTKKEEQIIYRHMFPLNLTRFPNSKEAAVVCAADKICALTETVTKKNYNPVLTEDFLKLAASHAKTQV
jgi:uncharacterized protein